MVIYTFLIAHGPNVWYSDFIVMNESTLWFLCKEAIYASNHYVYLPFVPADYMFNIKKRYGDISRECISQISTTEIYPTKSTIFHV